MHFQRSLPFILCVSSASSTSGHVFPTRVQDSSRGAIEASHVEYGSTIGGKLLLYWSVLAAISDLSSLLAGFLLLRRSIRC